MSSPITEPKLAPNEYPAQSVADIATDMQQNLDVMLNWLKAEPFAVMWFQGRWVVSGEGAIAAIAHFSKDIANRTLARRGLLKAVTPASKSTQPDGKASAPGKTAAKPAAKSKTTAKKPTAARTKAKPTPVPAA